jgi:PPOX class probable F420-dependent enzyme
MFSAEELRFTESQRVAHLATANANGRPHVVPVCFAYLEGRIYIAIDEKPKRSLRLKRLRNIDENPQVALVLDRYDEDWSRLAWVLVQGTASVLDAGPEHGRALAALREKYPQYRAMALEGRPVISMTVERVSSWGYLA